MRTDRNVAALSLALLLGACGKTPEPSVTISDDLKKDLAVATVGDMTPGGATQGYQRMRFVSAIEQSKTATPAKRATASNRRIKPAVSHRGPVDAGEDHHRDQHHDRQPAPVSAGNSPEPEMGTRGGHGGGGWGGLIGGIIGSVVIRGGHGGVDKCDPRTDGRARPPISDRPDFSMPLPIGRPTFPGPRH